MVDQAQHGVASHFVQDQNVAAQGGQIPATNAAADRLLGSVGVRISEPLGRTAATREGRAATAGELKASESELRPAHALLKRLYKGVYTEKVSAEATYAQDKDYQLRTLSDDQGAYGVASGWFLGKTGFQIDYLSPIEHPRPGLEERDVTAGLAMMRKLAHAHGAQALWVEVDAEMRGHYEKAGFVDFASPQKDDPSGLTMMVLPLSAKMKGTLGTDEGKAKVWAEHITAWYEANWADHGGVGAPGAQEALEKMRADLGRGERTWFQALP